MSTEDGVRDEAQEVRENDAETQESKPEDARAELRRRIEEDNVKSLAALQVMKEGMGRLQLETPIRARSRDIEELVYDFTALTGKEYIEAMDSSPVPANTFGITYRQALALFATAAAKQTNDVDAQDILERIGMTDAATGEQLARLFFNASTRAGRLRISKK